MMNRNPHTRSLPAALMLVLFLSVSFFGAEGTLLCFGKDGHMAIEFVETHDCPASGARLVGMENDACGPCKDVQFLSIPANTTNSSHYTKTLPLISPSQVSPALPSKGYPDRYDDLSQSPHHKTLASLLSVVLLI